MEPGENQGRVKLYVNSLEQQSGTVSNKKGDYGIVFTLIEALRQE
jgi:hypothetical protein